MLFNTYFLSETPPQAHEAFSMPAGILQLSTSYILFYSTVSVVFSYHVLAGPQQPKIHHCIITATANPLDFFKEFLWMAFAVVFLSCQCYLLQTISWKSWFSRFTLSSFHGILRSLVINFAVHLSQCHLRSSTHKKLIKKRFSSVSRFLTVFLQCPLENAPEEGKTIWPPNY